jgi:hypothetical protein
LGGFPSQAIAYCLPEAGLRLADVDHVAINTDDRAHRSRKVGYVLGHSPNTRLVLARLRNRRRQRQVMELLLEAFPGDELRGGFHNIEHHLAHLSSVFHVSPFEEALVVSVDGFGDFASAAWGVGRRNEIEISGRIYHDDRKPLARWLTSQLRYAREETEYLLDCPPSALRRTDKIRLMGWPAPIGVFFFFFTLFVKGCLFDGWPGWYYAFQRTIAEMLIALEIIDRRWGGGWAVRFRQVECDVRGHERLW